MTPHPATTVLAKALFLLAIAAAAGCDRDGAQMPIGQKTHELKLTGMQEPCPAGLSENGRPVSQAVLDRVRQVKVTWPEGVAIDRERRDGVFYHDAIVFDDPTSDGPPKTLTGCSASIDELAAWACVRNPANEGLPCAPERLDRPPHPEAPVMPSKPEDLKDPAGRACEQLPVSLSGFMLVRCVFGPESMAVAREKAREQGKAQDRADDGAARQTGADASLVGDENGLPARRPTVQPPFGRVAPDDRIRIVAPQTASLPAAGASHAAQDALPDATGTSPAAQDASPAARNASSSASEVSSPAHGAASSEKKAADGHAVPARGKGAPDAGTDIDGLQFVRNDKEVAAMVRTFEMISRARERADAVGAEAASREFQIPQLALSVKDLPLTGPVAHPPFGTALAVTPAGSWKNDRWTGLARYFRMGDGTWIELAERDLAASRGMLYLTPAMVNVDINGKPASATAFVDGSGRRLRRVIWVRGPRLYELTVLDPQSGSDQAGSTRGGGTLAGRSVLDMARMTGHP